jgi:penicillin amidase
MLLPGLLPLLSDAGLNKRAANARDRLARWDGTMDRHRAEPLIYHTWIDRLARSFAAGRNLANDSMALAMLERPRVLTRVLDAPERWCPSAPDDELENGCEPMIAGAFAAAVDDLAHAFGDDVDRWHWGDAHRAVFANRLFATIPLLDRWTTIDVGTDGDDDTVDRGTVAMGARGRGSWFYTPPLYPHIHGPGFREILDFADLDRSRFMQATGQSGNPLSPHYRDLSERWAAGNYVSLPPAPRAGEAEPATESLVLVPQQAVR